MKKIKKNKKRNGAGERARVTELALSLARFDEWGVARCWRNRQKILIIQAFREQQGVRSPAANFGAKKVPPFEKRALHSNNEFTKKIYKKKEKKTDSSTAEGAATKVPGELWWHKNMQPKKGIYWRHHHSAYIYIGTRAISARPKREVNNKFLSIFSVRPGHRHCSIDACRLIYEKNRKNFFFKSLFVRCAGALNQASDVWYRACCKEKQVADDVLFVFI